jgi:Ca2+-binding RTX toxin-like protein
MRRNLLAAAACLAAFVALGAPGAAMADTPSTGTADINVSVSVFTRASDGTYSVPASDPSAPIVIGESEQVRATVSNAGPDAATVTLRLSQLGGDDPNGVNAWMASSGIEWDHATCGRVGDLPDWCTFTLPVGSSWVIHPVLMARLPGTGRITFTATETASDPDPTDDTAAWRAPLTCQFTGTPGDDTLVAGPGESVCGGHGDDTLIAEPGARVLGGGDGNDTFLVGRGGGVYVSGGAGVDTVSYANARNPIMMCPSAPAAGMWSGGMASPEDGGATMWGIENVIGSPFGDRMLGNSADNEISGGGGNDWIGGGGGDDVLQGGPGADLFRTTDHARDVVSGGLGRDRADVDRTDRVTSAADVGAPPYHDPCLA